LRRHFEEYGELLEVVVIKDRNTHKSRGFGFVTFKEPSAADAVLAAEKPHVVLGKEIDVKRSVPQETVPKDRKIFVGGLSTETTEQVLLEYFSQFGPVTESQIMCDHISGRSRGFGFVTFQNEESAAKVFSQGMVHMLNDKKVEVKPATPKYTGTNNGSHNSTGTQEAKFGTRQSGGEYIQQQQQQQQQQFGYMVPHHPVMYSSSRSTPSVRQTGNSPSSSRWGTNHNHMNHGSQLPVYGSTNAPAQAFQPIGFAQVPGTPRAGRMVMMMPTTMVGGYPPEAQDGNMGSYVYVPYDPASMPNPAAGGFYVPYHVPQPQENSSSFSSPQYMPMAGMVSSSSSSSMGQRRNNKGKTNNGGSLLYRRSHHGSSRGSDSDPGTGRVE
jgi:RNA recognition motif-containing protein